MPRPHTGQKWNWTAWLVCSAVILCTVSVELIHQWIQLHYNPQYQQHSALWRRRSCSGYRNEVRITRSMTASDSHIDRIMICCILCYIIMAAEGKTIIFCCCNLLFLFLIFNFVGIDERPVMGSRPNLVSGSEWCQFTNANQKFLGLPFPP